MTLAFFLPSRDLPRLARRGNTKPIAQTDILHALACLAKALGVERDGLTRYRVTLHGTEGGMGCEDGLQEDDGQITADQFETHFARQWLQQVTCLRWLDGVGDEEVDEQSVEDVVQEASRLITVMSGQSASGNVRRQYEFSGPGVGHAVIGTTVHVHEVPLVEDSLGARTWAAAPLLAAFALKKLERGLQGQPSSFLELGAGTGLVGLAVARKLSEMQSEAIVHLTDYHPHVLSNLARNITLNGLPASVAAAPLDWTSIDRFSEALLPSYECLLAADCVYEESHARLVHRMASRFLSRNAGTNHADSLNGKLLLLSTIRPTHSEDLAAIYKVFPPSSSSDSTKDGPRTCLRTTHQYDILADDDDHFGPPSLNLTVQPTPVKLIKATLSARQHVKQISSSSCIPRPSFNLCIIEWCQA